MGDLVRIEGLVHPLAGFELKILLEAEGFKVEVPPRIENRGAPEWQNLAAMAAGWIAKVVVDRVAGDTLERIERAVKVWIGKRKGDTPQRSAVIYGPDNRPLKMIDVPDDEGDKD